MTCEWNVFVHSVYLTATMMPTEVLSTSNGQIPPFDWLKIKNLIGCS